MRLQPRSCRHRGPDQLLEGGLVELLAFANVDGSARVPLETGVEQLLGSGREAPRKKVSFTTCLYDSPVQTPPSCDQTGVPGEEAFAHFHSSWISGSASWISRRSRASVSPRQSPELLNPLRDVSFARRPWRVSLR